METLDSLAIKYGTDKSSLINNYCVKYDKILSEHRLTFKNILELGVQSGASLKMWKEYFINAAIIGIDNNAECKHLEEERIKIFIGNQIDTIFLNNVCKNYKIDLIVDDGSHLWSDQISSFKYLFKYALNAGGIYIIEDACTSYWNEFSNNYKMSTISFFLDKVNDVNFHGIRCHYNNINTRREDFLIKHALESNQLRKDEVLIESIHFMNSVIVIYKR